MEDSSTVPGSKSRRPRSSIGTWYVYSNQFITAFASGWHLFACSTIPVRPLEPFFWHRGQTRWSLIQWNLRTWIFISSMDSNPIENQMLRIEFGAGHEALTQGINSALGSIPGCLFLRCLSKPPSSMSLPHDGSGQGFVKLVGSVCWTSFKSMILTDKGG